MFNHCTFVADLCLWHQLCTERNSVPISNYCDNSWEVSSIHQFYEYTLSFLVDNQTYVTLTIIFILALSLDFTLSFLPFLSCCCCYLLHDFTTTTTSLHWIAYYVLLRNCSLTHIFAAYRKFMMYWTIIWHTTHTAIYSHYTCVTKPFS